MIQPHQFHLAAEPALLAARARRSPPVSPASRGNRERNEPPAGHLEATTGDRPFSVLWSPTGPQPAEVGGSVGPLDEAEIPWSSFGCPAPRLGFVAERGGLGLRQCPPGSEFISRRNPDGQRRSLEVTEDTVAHCRADGSSGEAPRVRGERVAPHGLGLFERGGVQLGEMESRLQVDSRAGEVVGGQAGGERAPQQRECVGVLVGGRGPARP